MYNNEEFNGFELRERFNASRREQEEAARIKRESLLEAARQKELTLEQFDVFKNEVKEFLLTEALAYIPCKYNVLESKTSRDKCKNTIYTFIKENGATKLLDIMSTKTQLLAEMANAIDASYKSIVEKCDKCDKLTFTIKPTDTTDFYRSMEKLDAEDVATKIRDRVEDALDTYIQGNMNDKLNMEETASKIKAKVDAMKKPDDEVKQEYARLYTREVLEQREARPKNIYEAMLNANTRAILKNSEYRDKFISESGKLDISSITEVTTGAYTALETLNTINLMEMNRSIVKELIDNIE